MFELWGLNHALTRPDIPIPGSPERCIVRSVVEDIDGNLWILKRLASRQRERREIMGRNLEWPRGASLQSLAPYRRTKEGFFTLEHDGFLWQLSPFFLGTPLPLPNALPG